MSVNDGDMILLLSDWREDVDADSDEFIKIGDADDVVDVGWDSDAEDILLVENSTRETLDDDALVEVAWDAAADVDG
jgi:hypothetical protein